MTGNEGMSRATRRSVLVGGVASGLVIAAGSARAQALLGNTMPPAPHDGTTDIFHGVTRYFSFFNDGLANQSSYGMQDPLAAPRRTVIDASTLSSDGTVAITGGASPHSRKHSVSRCARSWPFRLRMPSPRGGHPG